MPSLFDADSPGRADAGLGRLATLAPLSSEMIAAVLDARGYRYFTDDDGDLGGWWDDNLVYFLRLGERGGLLEIRTRVEPAFEPADAPRLYEFCNAWNAGRLWPKAYVHTDDDGAWVYGEVSADLDRGVGTDQLDQLILCGIGSGCELAGAVSELRGQVP